MDVLAVPLAYLARMNTLVALFNLVPGFPLDGGRVLRALVWWRTGDFEGASRAASVVGQGFATVFVVVGLLRILGGDVVGGAWIALIGWFLQSAATVSQGQAQLTKALGGVRVAQAMSRECARVSGDATLDRIVREEVLGAGRRCLVVLDDGRLAGLLTLHEIKTVPRERWSKVTASEAMVPADRLATVGPDDHLLGALERRSSSVREVVRVTAGGRATHA